MRYPTALLAGRASRATASLAAVFVLVLATGFWRLNQRDPRLAASEVHRPSDRAAMLERIADALVPQALERPAGAALCPELVNVKQAFDVRLATLSDDSIPTQAALMQRYVFDLERYTIAEGRHCAAQARELDEEMKRSWPLIAIRSRWREGTTGRSAARWGSRYWQPDPRDLETKNAWAVLPGCIRSRAGSAVGGACDGQAANRMSTLLDDPMLAAALEHRLVRAAQTPAGRTAEFRGRPVETGRDLTVTLDPALQSRTGALARCFTGQTQACPGLLPNDMARSWHFFPGMMRAGAATVVIVQVRTGEVLVASGALSDCTARNLERQAQTESVSGRDRLPVFRPRSGELCSQLPDATGAQAYLTLPLPFWTVGPGSTMKPFALLAGIDVGQVPAMDNEHYRRLLATSHDPDGGQAVPQRIARLSAPRFREMLQYAGFAGERVDVLFGGDADAGWQIPVRAGFAGEAFTLSEEVFQQVRAVKKNGRNADATFGHRVVSDYLRAQRLSIAAIGGGSIRHSAWGLADWSRRLVLRAQGAETMTPTHLVRDPNTSSAPVVLDFAHVDSVRRLVDIMNAATSSKLGGTAAASCRAAFGACPAEGHPALLLAKTGTSEATDGGEASPYMKAGGSGTPPAKLFMAAFVGADGEIYAGGAMTLRVRERPGSPSPELQGNSAAELLLLAAAPLLKKTD